MSPVTHRITVGDLVRVARPTIIEGTDYTDRRGTVMRERFDVRGFTLFVTFPEAGLASDWFHPDELER